jgi:hypothetical protein
MKHITCIDDLRMLHKRRVLPGRRKNFGNFLGHVKDAESLSSIGAWAAGQLNPSLSWKGVEWIRGYGMARS